jgi:hypothetical protein
MLDILFICIMPGQAAKLVQKNTGKKEALAMLHSGHFNIQFENSSVSMP